MKLTKPTLPALLYLAAHMRESDARELLATRFEDTLDPESMAVEFLARSKQGVAWVATLDDGTPVAFFGATQCWPRVYSCYMIATHEINRIGRALTSFTKRVLIPYLLETGHRAEARSIDGHEHAHRWLRAIGGHEQARDRKFGKDGEDFLVFVVER